MLNYLLILPVTLHHNCFQGSLGRDFALILWLQAAETTQECSGSYCKPLGEFVTMIRIWLNQDGRLEYQRLNGAFKLVMNKFRSYIKTFFTKALGTKTNKLLKRMSWKIQFLYWLNHGSIYISGDTQKNVNHPGLVAIMAIC